jgi:hypothetical protein
VRVLQPTEAVSFTIERSVSDTNAETKLAEHTAGLKVGVENQVEVSGTVGVASGKEAVKVAVEGTYGYKTSDQTLTQTATGSVERVTFNAYKLKGTPTAAQGCPCASAGLVVRNGRSRRTAIFALPMCGDPTAYAQSGRRDYA